MSSINHNPSRSWSSSNASKHVLISLIAAGQLFYGCRVSVPVAAGTNRLPNGITEYWHPSFEKQTTPLGLLFIGGSTAIGAWKGYESNVAMRWRGWERPAEKQPVGNAAIGALAGFTSSLLLTLIMGGSGKEGVTSEGAADWLSDINDRLILIPADTLYPGRLLSTIKGIPRNADVTFVINTLEDAELYLSVFSDNPHRDAVLDKAVATLERTRLLDFAALVQGLPAERRATERYIAGIVTIEEAVSAATRCGVEYRSAVESRAAALAHSIDDYQKYLATFPEGASADLIRQRLDRALGNTRR